MRSRPQRVKRCSSHFALSQTQPTDFIMPTISFADSSMTIDVEAGSALIDACEENGAPVEFSCTVGACATCIISIEEGADNVNAPDGDEISCASSRTDVAGARLACQITVNGDITVRYLG